MEEVDELFVLDEPFLALGQPFGDLFRQTLLARHELGVAAEQDVRAAARHVRRNRDRALPSRLRDELRFLRVVLRVEHHVLVDAAAGRRAALQAALVEQRRQLLGFLDRDRPDENRPALGMFLDDFRDDRVPLFRLGPVDEVRVLDAAQRPVRRDDDDVELVNLVELLGLGVGGAGHAGELLVLAEVILEGDGRERLILALDLDLLLRLHRLVQAVAPSPARHQTAGELVDDHDFAVLDHVIHVPVKDDVGAQRLIDMVKDRHVLGVVQAGGTVVVLLQALDEALGLGHPALGQRHGLVLFVDDVVARCLERLALLGLRVAPDDGALLQLRDDPIDLVIEVGRFLRRARNDERRPRLVDEDAVHLVDDREVVPALDVVRQLELHVVAEIVEPELVVRAVGDVGGVRHLALGVVELVLDHADGHPEEAVDAAHPLGVAAGEVVVHGHDVDALALERVQVGGKRGDERLALAGLHLRDPALVKDRAADELHVEVPHVQHALAGFADDGERLDQQVVERFALRQTRARNSAVLARSCSSDSA